MRNTTIAIAALSLAACQQPATPENTTPLEAAPQPTNDVAVAPVEAPSADPASATPEPVDTPAPVASPSPSPSASPTPAETAAFPPRFRGRWGLTRADCDPKRADNKGLMRIQARMVRFYESRGPATTIDRETPGTLFATLAMSGEGQTWTDKTRFTLGNGGKTLLRASDQGEPPLLYKACD